MKSNLSKSEENENILKNLNKKFIFLKKNINLLVNHIKKTLKKLLKQ